MRKTEGAEGSVPRWQREDAQEAEADYFGGEPHEGHGRFAAEDEEDAYEQRPTFVDLHHGGSVPQAPARDLPSAVASRWQKKEYPTTEHAVRTLALHTGLGYMLGLGIGLVGKAQARVARMMGESAHAHHIDPFLMAGEFARPLFMVACLDVTLMYAGPAVHNLKLPWAASPLATSTSSSSAAAASASAQTKEATSSEQAEGLVWELYEEDGETGEEGRGRGRAKGSDTARALTRDEFARGTAGRREYSSLDAAQAYGEPAEEDVR